jgi:DNA-binding CsgD family transcriptional regulator
MEPFPEQDPLQARLRNFREAAFRIPSLTPRQYEVLHWLAGGHSNDEIAEGLFITTRTVKAHVAALMEQLGVTSRLELAVTALLGHLESTGESGRVGAGAGVSGVVPRQARSGTRAMPGTGRRAVPSAGRPGGPL